MIKFIKPLGDFVINKPDTFEPLAKDGENVEWSIYWQRRLNDGVIEVVETDKPKEKGK